MNLYVTHFIEEKNIKTFLYTCKMFRIQYITCKLGFFLFILKIWLKQVGWFFSNHYLTECVPKQIFWWKDEICLKAFSTVTFSLDSKIKKYGCKNHGSLIGECKMIDSLDLLNSSCTRLSCWRMFVADATCSWRSSSFFSNKPAKRLKSSFNHFSTSCFNDS